MHHRLYNEIQLHQRRVQLLEEIAKAITELPEEFDHSVNDALKHLVSEQYADVSDANSYIVKLVDAIKMNHFQST